MQQKNNVSKAEKSPHPWEPMYRDGKEVGLRCPASTFEFHFVLGKLSELEKHLKVCPLNKKRVV